MTTLIHLLFYSVISMAGGDWVGNGGNVISCGDSLRLLDYYEGEEQRRILPELGPEHMSFQQKVYYVLHRLEDVNPTRARMYKKWFRTFDEETQWFIVGKFLPIRDSGVVIIPEDCNIQQVAIQRPTPLIMPGDRRYVIDLRLFEKLSEDDKAGLILHELIYREAIELGTASSPGVRYFNQVISSYLMKSFDSRTMLDLVRTAGLKHVDYHGFAVGLEAAQYHDDGSIRTATVWGGSLHGQNITGKYVNFYPNGKIESFLYTSADAYTFNLNGQTFPIGHDGSLSRMILLKFHDNGNLMSVSIKNKTPFILNGKQVLLSNLNGAVTFWPNGQLHTGTIESSEYTGPLVLSQEGSQIMKP
ncbi:hypothetical protein ACNQKP_16000 [Bdellovibrio bacteriovorus]|uniref:hypothetical protein n=1 Tax=Bdellovibrio bacteriovorus TaxID=959 RepID=UPI003AA7E5B0